MGTCLVLPSRLRSRYSQTHQQLQDQILSVQQEIHEMKSKSPGSAVVRSAATQAVVSGVAERFFFTSV